MEILLITNEFPNPLDPTKAVFNLCLARALAGEHRLRVVSPISWLDEWRARPRCRVPIGRQRGTVPDGVEVHYPRYYYPPGAFRGWYGWFYWQSVRGTIGRLLAARRPDVVLGYWAHPDGAAAVRAARMAGVPAGLMVGGSDVLLLTRRRGRREGVLRALRGADAVITASEHLRAAVTGLGIHPDKVHVWYKGVDEGLFSPGDRLEARRRLGIPAEGRVLVWVGRMVPVKGLDVLLRACTTLRHWGIDFHLHLVGDGPLRKHLEAECATRGLSGTVSFIGPRLHDQLPDWYRAADLTVLPSRSEGLPNVLRESLACGTPFVASRVGGIPEIAGEDRCLLAEPEDPEDLADQIARALAEQTPGRPTCSRLTGWDESAESLVRIIRPLVSVSPNIGTPHALAARS